MQREPPGAGALGISDEREGELNGRAWTPWELAIVSELYSSRPTKEVAEKIGCDIGRVYRAAARLGLKKSEEFIASDESGRLKKGQTRTGSEVHQFKKGQVPFNKGMRRPGWSPGRMKETQFQKGGRSGIAARNWKPIGTILADSQGFLRIKVRDAIHGQEATGFGNTKAWPLLNRVVWEEHKGPIPPKHIVAFKDKDRSNCAIDNLELISMADNCRRNSLWAKLPRELAEVIQLTGALKRRIRRLSGEKQN